MDPFSRRLRGFAPRGWRLKAGPKRKATVPSAHCTSAAKRYSKALLRQQHEKSRIALHPAAAQHQPSESTHSLSPGRTRGAAATETPKAHAADAHKTQRKRKTSLTTTREQ